MLIIDYNKSSFHGISRCDGDVEDMVLGLVRYSAGRHKDYITKVNTENAIHAARVLLKEGKIDPEDIAFQFKGEILRPDKNGRLEKWPEGFCDSMDNWLSRLL